MLLSNDLFLFRAEIQLKSNERNNSPKLYSSHCESQTGNDENVANIGKIHYLDNSEVKERLDKR